jgi:hypothetical protein
MKRLLLLLLISATAHARPCPTLVHEALNYARDPITILRAYADLRSYAQQAEAHADGVFVDPNRTYRATVASALHSQFIGPATDCGDTELGAGNATASLYASLEHRPYDLKLSLFGAGRMDFSSIALPDSEDEITQHTLSLTNGLYGAHLQLTRWFSLSLAGMHRSTSQGSDPDWRTALAPENTHLNGYLVELGVPKLGFLLRLTHDGEVPQLHEIAFIDVPLTDALRASVSGRMLRVEDRRILTTKGTYTFGRKAGMTVAWGLQAAVEDRPANLRHLRLTLENQLFSHQVTRTSYSRIGARAEQYAALTLHRGAQMRASSDASAAVGAAWRARVGMQSPYIYVFFDFGLSFNRPEMLDLLPYAINRGMLDIGINLAQRW